MEHYIHYSKCLTKNNFPGKQFMQILPPSIQTESFNEQYRGVYLGWKFFSE